MRVAKRFKLIPFQDSIVMCNKKFDIKRKLQRILQTSLSHFNSCLFVGYLFCVYTWTRVSENERDLFVYVNNFFWYPRVFFTLIHRGILFENTIIEIRWLVIMYYACLVFKFKFFKNSSNITSPHWLVSAKKK